MNIIEDNKRIRAQLALHEIMAACNYFINRFNQDCQSNDAYASFVEAARQAKLLLDKSESEE